MRLFDTLNQSFLCLASMTLHYIQSIFFFHSLFLEHDMNIFNLGKKKKKAHVMMNVTATGLSFH